MTLALVACDTETVANDSNPDGAAGGATAGGPNDGGTHGAGGQVRVDAGPLGGAIGGAHPPADAARASDAQVAPPDAAHPDAAPGRDAAPGNTATGQSCNVAADCGEGYDCYTQVHGGYCMPGAPGGPTSCRLPEAGCPEQTLCSPLPWHAISGVCLLACDAPTDCRDGYVCGVVELFPGEADSPRSPGAACWVRVVCEFGADQTCNDDPVISSIHGRCLQDGTCECNGGSPRNEETGRCR